MIGSKKLSSDGENEIKKQFLNADKIIKTSPIIPQKHSDDMHTSKMISIKTISNTINELLLTSKPIDLINVPANY
ncbi:hypothetical protein C2G38_2062727 [Gigaspora rosea]|uniref:Uncharacterized protein n=1 Tax=Gigaspora rosea TaxID=44941 RepID=A0A397W1L5_9GLOM|nr:hypothetical protein C2G38_2062727 [Gigaspora rosea]